MPEHHVRYSDIKPIVRFARAHWGNPQTDTPFRSFVDTGRDIQQQLKATRRQVTFAGVYLLKRGRKADDVVTELESAYKKVRT